MNKEEIKNIANIIDCNFRDGLLKDQLINYKRLLVILDDKNLSLTDAEKLIKASKKLNHMLKVIENSKNYDDMLDNENFYTLMIAYLKLNKKNTDILTLDKYDFTPMFNSKRDENNIRYFYNDLNFIKKLTPEEEREISIKASNGDEEARKKLVELNIKLAISIAKFYHINTSNLSFEDLIQDGCIGLIKAAERYDYHKGYKYSTYATWWIRQQIKRGILNKSRTIRIPVYLGFICGRIYNYKNKALKMYGFVPSDETIAEELNIPLHLIKRASSIVTPMSLDAPVTSRDGEDGDDDDRVLANVIPDDKDDYEELENKMVENQLLKFIDETELKERERKVIMYKYGLYGVQPLNNTQIGRILGISHERVRQIHEVALRKLSKNNNIRILRDVEPLPEPEIKLTKSGTIRKRKYKQRVSKKSQNII